MKTASCCLSVAGLLLALLPPCTHAVGPEAPFTPPAKALPVTAPLPAASAASSADPAAATPPALTGLRMGHTPAALIDGAWVGVGQEVRGARLIEVRPGAVRLRHADGRLETMALFTDSSAAALTPRRVVLSLPAALRELP